MQAFHDLDLECTKLLLAARDCLHLDLGLLREPLIVVAALGDPGRELILRLKNVVYTTLCLSAIAIAMADSSISSSFIDRPAVGFHVGEEPSAMPPMFSERNRSRSFVTASIDSMVATARQSAVGKA